MMDMQLHPGERLIRPSAPAIRYTGRIDDSNPDAPFLIYVCSQVEFRVTGRILRVFLENIHSFYENRLGVIINGVESAVLLENGEQVLDLSDRMTDGENHVLLFKRQDCCHALVLHGFAVAENAALLPLPPRPTRRMEVYGDSVSAGEVSEAEFACGQSDPEGHNGRYSNGYLSYAWQTARLLGAELHDIATGGMALEDKTGYFFGPDYIGMLSSWDKINYYPPFGAKTDWDFRRFTPHVVVVAIGQNDANPVNFMAQDYDSEASRHWRSAYAGWIRAIRGKYPNAQIILTTTILGHDAAWDRAIDDVARELAATDKRVHHFLYSKNGCGTPGHIRGSEAAGMAQELAGFIESLPAVWEE